MHNNIKTSAVLGNFSNINRLATPCVCGQTHQHYPIYSQDTQLGVEFGSIVLMYQMKIQLPAPGKKKTRSPELRLMCFNCKRTCNLGLINGKR